MTQNRKNSGFSLAEMLIVVAIIGVLMGVSFVAVQSHQRSSTRLEFDTIAREIFFAAQNHLTSVESQGYLQQNQFGHPGKVEGVDSEDADDIYYLVSGDSESTEMLKLIMPDYAIVSEGSYIIRYQVSSAKVLDVFYSNPGKSSMLTVAGKTLGTVDFAPLMGRDPDYREDGLKNRERYPGGVVGWYGGEDAEEQGIRLRVPSLEIINAEKLMVKVTDPNAPDVKQSYLVKLIVTGKSSGAEAYFTLKGSTATEQNQNRITATSADDSYLAVLDDITAAGMHFANIKADKGAFIPGENLEIKAVAYSVDTLSNIAMSRTAKTNSLFAELRDADGDNTPETAVVNNIRHLENLDAAVSNLETDGTKTGGDESYEMTGALQVSDLIWKDSDSVTNAFASRIKTLNNTTAEPSIWLWNVTTAAATSPGKYYPVSPGYTLTYDGQGNSVANLDIAYAGAAGMFGTLDEENGEIEIKNVIVRNDLEDDSALEIKGGGSAGGLVGSMTGGKITNCAAAVYVNGATAGGLIGTANGVTVKDSYAGGHTSEGKYLPAISGAGRVNVIASGNAGGLIGSMTGGTAANCYATCSVMGATAVGGFAGTASGEITNSYCTGLVLGPAALITTNSTVPVKAFVGSVSGMTVSDCWYYSSINDNYYAAIKRALKEANDPTANAAAETAIEELEAGCAGANAFDKDRPNGTNWIVTAFEAYKQFRPDSLGVDEAKPYDEYLTNHYRNTEDATKTDYPLKTIRQMDTDAPDFAAVHYGDWPAPEILVVNPA